MNLLGAEKRIAVKEENEIVELFFQRPDEEDIVGNIYAARVLNVLPGMQAAFVDIGMDKSAYLHHDDMPGNESVHQGQALLVQVVKAAVDSKGPKVTSKLEFTGKYIVYMPYDATIAVSRKIKDEQVRRTLLELGQKYKENGGFIFRSACERISPELIEREIQQLHHTYKQMKEKQGKVPFLVHTPLSFFNRLFNEIPVETVTEVIVDDRTAVNELKAAVGAEKVVYYGEKENIFVHYGVEQELEKALKKVVWLANGAYLLIEQTETMTVIDVNTGKFTGKQNLQDTVLKTNELAAKEIARQLRLRDIGGMILVDFINMKDPKAKETVRQTLIQAIKADGTPTRVLQFTALGILEMTRKRKRKSLRDYMMSACTCHSGYTPSAETIAYELQRELLGYKSDYEAVLVEAPSHVEEVFLLHNLQDTLRFSVYFIEGDVPHYRILHFGTKEEMKKRL
ncbi:Rne/Rng family ribonuclease [Microbacteriaceae bacterium 4G12]